MTVKQLLAELLKHDMDALVIIIGDDSFYVREIDEIIPGYLVETKGLYYDRFFLRNELKEEDLMFDKGVIFHKAVKIG